MSALPRSRADGGSASGQDHCSAGDPLIRLALRVDVCGISQVPRRPILCLCSGLGPRLSRRSLAMTVSSMLPLLFRRQRLQRLSYRGYRGASAPAVYASWGMLPLPMQDSLPAGWLAFAERELNPLDRDERFPSYDISSPFPGFILTLQRTIPSAARGMSRTRVDVVQTSLVTRRRPGPAARSQRQLPLRATSAAVLALLSSRSLLNLRW